MSSKKRPPSDFGLWLGQLVAMCSWRQWILAACLYGALAAPVAAANFVVGTTVSRTGSSAEITIELACNVEYVEHFPDVRGKRLRIQLHTTSICSGVSPILAGSRELHRPTDADLANLLEIDYNGSNASSQHLTLSFSEDVLFNVIQGGISNTLLVEVVFDNVADQQLSSDNVASTRVQPESEPTSLYVINLSSSQRPHSTSEVPAGDQFSGETIFESVVELTGGAWYRLQLGHFDDAEEAASMLARVQPMFPNAWIGRETSRVDETKRFPLGADTQPVDSALGSVGLDRVDALMADARSAMVAGELAQAVQLYTKILRVAEHDRHAEAQEYLALTRERNGQIAHAKAEYQKFLERYPDDEGVVRVKQRLAALLAADRRESAANTSAQVTSASARSRSRISDWRVQTFFTQYYRRDANQLNEEDEIVSQSALYSDINIDARRRGERFDFSSRLSGGYRNDFLDEGQGSGDEYRLSYAYADLADSETRLRGRIGRQSKNTGGVLGRFDGIDLSYQLNDRASISTVAGLPVNSVRDGTDSERVFYGANVSYRPQVDNLELGTFFIQQEIEGVEDRQAVGAEFRYFGETRNLWGLIDYDLSYSDLSSAFLQGSWRFASRSTIHGSIDRRHSPYLSTGAAMIGQPVETFAELLVLLTEEEIRQLSVDRSPLSTSYTAGLSHSLTPKLQVNLDANQTTVTATPESGGVAATPESTFQYFSTSLIASSLLREGDVSMIGLRMSDSATTEVLTMTLDTRIPFGRTWRLNPRLRVDRREILSDGSEEWLYTPGIRIHYRRSQKVRFELEAGRQFSQRETNTIDLDRKSYFVNVGYQAFF